ncbi:MAG: biotin transporter BioY [Bacillota bacterium]|nr:biotin transporter BioY [Bacillota bacterium]
MRKLTTKNLTAIALMSAVMAICSWLTVPTAVPFTLQTFAVFFSLEYLGGKKGTLAILVYILLGAVGLPVFSGFAGGIGHLAGPTGGYIIGFIASGIIYRLGEKFTGESELLHYALEAVCLIACYALGTLRYCRVTGTELWAALCVCVLPFIIPDALKLALAHIAAKRVGLQSANK